MDVIVKTVQQKSVEITEQLFKDLTADMVPTSVKELQSIALDLITGHANGPEDIMANLEKCRRFLNTQHALRGLMIAFKGETQQSK